MFCILTQGCSFGKWVAIRERKCEAKKATKLEKNDRGSNSTRQLNRRQKSQTKSSESKMERGLGKKVMIAHLMSASVTEMTGKFRDWRCHGNWFLCCWQAGGLFVFFQWMTIRADKDVILRKIGVGRQWPWVLTSPCIVLGSSTENSKSCSSVSLFYVLS